MRITQVPLTPRNAKRLAWLDAMCFPDDTAYPKDSGYWWLAWDGEQYVGFAGLEVLNQHSGFLCRVGVLHSARGQGLHKRLIRAREHRARALGLRSLVTYTSRDNLRSANNLIHLGFVLYRPDNEFGLKDSFYFRKEIA
jgi:GNAT superfamily N-acetyltransferase